MRAMILLGTVLGYLCSSARAADPVPLPQAAPGWRIELIANAPEICLPTAIVQGPDGTIYVGQNPIDRTGPPTAPGNSIVAIKPDGTWAIFADRLGTVMGLEWVDDRLFVVHAPFLSALKDTDGDGKADQRTNLITGLGPAPSTFNGIKHHLASGIRLGMDGYLYIAVGDKGIPKGVGKDGTTIQLFGGGVIRIRPDGSGLEVVSTGIRNPLAVLLTAADEIFTCGNADDSKRWPGGLTHHIAGGHYGYPYQFLNHLDRSLPTLAGPPNGLVTQGLCYNEDGLPPRYRGNLFFCDWRLQSVFRYAVEKNGGTYRVAAKEPLVIKGKAEDFRPFSLAVSNDGRALWLADWATAGPSVERPNGGRIYRLTYEGPDSVAPLARPNLADPKSQIAALDHPAHAVQIRAQRLVSRDPANVPLLIARLAAATPLEGRVHAIWALDAVGTAESRAAIRSTFSDRAPEVRIQAARSAGIAKDLEAVSPLSALLREQDASIRREAAIALGKIGDRSAAPALFDALGDQDGFVSWSVRRALRSLKAWDQTTLVSTLLDDRRREDALRLTDEVWSIVVVNALAEAMAKTEDPAVRCRIVANLANLYHARPDWSGQWYGPNPLAGEEPAKTKPWSPEGMGRVLASLAKASSDPDQAVRRTAINGLATEVQRPATPQLRERLTQERDPELVAELARSLGNLRDIDSVPLLVGVLQDPSRPVSTRLAALDALGHLNDTRSLRARFALLYDKAAPPELVALVVQSLARERVLPPNDLANFLDHPSPPVRAAAVRSLGGSSSLPAQAHRAFMARFDDKDAEVRTAALEVVGGLQVREALTPLLRLSEQATTRTAAILALTQMPDARALGLYLSAISDQNPNLRRRAESALLSLRDVVSTELRAKAAKGEFSGLVADSIERVLTQFTPVQNWSVLGPLPGSLAQPITRTRPIDLSQSHTGADRRSLHWTPQRADPGTGRVVIVHPERGALDRDEAEYDPHGLSDLCALGYAEIDSSRERPAMLLIGSSGSIAVLLNERIVHESDCAGRPFAIDSDRVRVMLRKGRNRLLVQSRCGTGAWCFSVQVSAAPDLSHATAEHGSKREGLREFALAHDGKPTRGQTIFFDPRGVGCAKCHSAGGKGTATIGPDLTAVALKYDKAELVRSVLQPSSRIAAAYQTVVVRRKDNKVVTGLVRAESDALLFLIDADSRISRIPKKEIAERSAGESSLMPTGPVESLSPEEFADLIAYLQSLKTPAVSNAAVR
jgi:putative heme-binding domain-containing protein